MSDQQVTLQHPGGALELPIVPATQGESVYVAQGDSGSEACLQNGGTDGTLNVQDPGSQPFVTSVGGTTIGWTSLGAWA